MAKTREEKEFEKEEIRQARKRLVDEGAINFFIKPMLEHWKNHPIKSIGTFLLWATIFYTIFVGLQAVNYSMIYCDSTIDEYDGKIIPNYNNYVEYANEQTKKNNQMINWMNPEIDNTPKDNITCNYNLTEWKQESFNKKLTSTGEAVIEIGIKRWLK